MSNIHNDIYKYSCKICGKMYAELWQAEKCGIEDNKPITKFMIYDDNEHIKINYNNKYNHNIIYEVLKKDMLMYGTENIKIDYDYEMTELYYTKYIYLLALNKFENKIDRLQVEVLLIISLCNILKQVIKEYETSKTIKDEYMVIIIILKNELSVEGKSYFRLSNPYIYERILQITKDY